MLQHQFQRLRARLRLEQAQPVIGQQRFERFQILGHIVHQQEIDRRFFRHGRHFLRFGLSCKSAPARQIR